jgi:hypothetical protein
MSDPTEVNYRASNRPNSRVLPSEVRAVTPDPSTSTEARLLREIVETIDLILDPEGASVEDWKRFRSALADARALASPPPAPMTYLDTLDVACPICNATYTVGEEHVCTFASCPSCGGRGWTNRGDEWLRCIGCRMRAEQ